MPLRMFSNARSITRIKTAMMTEAIITIRALEKRSFQVGHVVFTTSSL